MQRLSLHAFISSGELGGVRCGLTQDEVEKLLGPPADPGSASPSAESPIIWSYGDIEIHFNQHTVWLISIQRFTGPDDTPSAGSRIGLDPWVIKEGLTLRAAERELSTAGLEHTEEYRAFLDQTALRLPSGVELLFSGDGGGAGLESICLPSEPVDRQ